jgi:hypothetical protein
MRRNPHQLLTGILLAIYGSISLLGYGLHELVPDGAHHHHGLAALQQGSGPPAVRTGGSVDDDHDCDICVFLDQARSVQPQVQSAIVWHHLVAAVEIVAPRLSPQSTELSHAPRGPPTNLG